VTKHLVDVDDELLNAAQSASGEPTIKATVHRALLLLLTENRRREAELRERWATLGDSLADLDDEDVMRQAWS
jgi:Arc/MetJ family transcription regulator